MVNIAAQIRGEAPEAQKEYGVLIPGPQAHLMKLGFEKYFLWKMRHGHVQLP